MIMNRRSFDRLPAIVDINCRQPDPGAQGGQLASSRDISEGGLGMVLQRRHDIGTLMDLEFKLPGTSEAVALRGRVAWVTAFKVGPDMAFDTGVEFVDLAPSVRDSITSVVSSRTHHPVH